MITSLVMLAQETVEAPSIDGLAIAIICALVAISVVLTLVGGWRIFQKAGEPGWASLIPLYNLFVVLRIVGAPGWWAVLFLVPAVNFIMSLIVTWRLARAFGQGVVGCLALALLPVVMIPVLGCGSARYRSLES